MRAIFKLEDADIDDDVEPHVWYSAPAQRICSKCGVHGKADKQGKIKVIKGSCRRCSWEKPPRPRADSPEQKLLRAVFGMTDRPHVVLFRPALRVCAKCGAHGYIDKQGVIEGRKP
jgi:hypothetical protein